MLAQQRAAIGLVKLHMIMSDQGEKNWEEGASNFLLPPLPRQVINILINSLTRMEE